MSNQRKRVLITGANKGVGLATVESVLKEREDTMVLLGSRSVKRGEDARREIVAANPELSDRVEVLQLDVADDQSLVGAVEWVKQRFEEERPLYGIVNNAGIGLGSAEMETVLDVNTRGPRRVCELFLPLLDQERGRVVNISSASGPMFVSGCSPERRAMFTDPKVSWEEIEAVMEEALEVARKGGDFQEVGLGEGSAYGLSKACLNAYTIALARENPDLLINACTPGFIETDLTRPMAEARGIKPEEMGMKQPSEGTVAAMKLLFGEPGGSGWYFGSDGERSPLDRYRSPGDPPYRGE